MDSQFFRKSKEAQTDYSARVDEETGRFKVIKRDRPSGRQKVIAEDLEPIEACKLRNSLIESSDG